MHTSDSPAANGNSPADLVSDGARQSELSAAVAHEPISMTWNRLNYFVKAKDGSEKQILHNLSGNVQPGEMVAIMGSSGAGKTSLINVLAGRVVDGRVEGHILVNGEKRTKRFRRQSAFVEQTDLLLANLTVRETLWFTACLRLPDTMSKERKLKRVEEVMRELGLEGCADTYIGGVFVQGVSGGEKRRVSMGVELLTRPSLIFLDEPTSGLDSTTAYRVIHTARQLAVRGRSVIVSIHQPKAKIFNMFHKVVLLAEGKCVFFGSPAEALVHFDTQGYRCPAYTNPADFFLDVVTSDGDSEESDKLVKTAIEKLSASFSGPDAKHEQLASTDPNNAPKLPPLRAESTDALDNHGGTTRKLVKGVSSSNSHETELTFANSWRNEFVTLVQRNFTNFRRNKGVTVIAFFSTTFVALLLGFLFFRMSNGQTDVQNRSGLLFFITTNQSFSTMFPVLIAFAMERPIFRRERAAASYRVSSYFLAKNLSEFPVQMCFPFLLSVIVYWLAGLQADAAKFFTFCAVTWCTAFVAQSLGLMLAAVSPTIQVAQALSPLVLTLFMLFGGLFLNSADVGPWFVWIKWLSFVNYAFRAFMQNEFTGLTLKPCNVNAGNSCFTTGEEVLDFFDVKEPSIAGCIGVMVGFGVLFRTLAYMCLRARDKPRLKFD